MVHFGEFLKTWSLRSNSVTRQVSFNRKKIGGKCQNSKIQMRHFEFSNNVPSYSKIKNWTLPIKNTTQAWLGLWGTCEKYPNKAFFLASESLSVEKASNIFK